jgi:hypothetical protein
MAATTPKALAGRDFLRTTASSSTVYTDGDLYFLVMSGKTRMRVMLRRDDEYFTTFVDREAVKLGVDVVVNGNMYDVRYVGLFWALLGTSSDPDNTLPEGFLIDSQVRIDGNSQPQRFYVSQTAGRSWKFGYGNPISVGTGAAVGGVGPLIIDGLKYGPFHEYKFTAEPLPGGQPYKPKPNEPSVDDAKYLSERQSVHFRNFQEQGPRRGKTVIAYASAADKVLVVHQPEQANTGIDLADLRDRLAAVGVDNAVFLDGGDSAMLWVNGIWHTSPAARKNHTNIVGVAFDVS